MFDTPLTGADAVTDRLGLLAAALRAQGSRVGVGVRTAETIVGQQLAYLVIAGHQPGQVAYSGTDLMDHAFALKLAQQWRYVQRVDLFEGQLNRHTGCLPAVRGHRSPHPILTHRPPNVHLAAHRVEDGEMMECMRPEPDDKPALPAHSEEETGIGWGEAPEPDDDERLRRDRPPHWDAD